jgi:hypothetical protein
MKRSTEVAIGAAATAETKASALPSIGRYFVRTSDSLLPSIIRDPSRLCFDSVALLC